MAGALVVPLQQCRLELGALRAGGLHDRAHRPGGGGRVEPDRLGVGEVGDSLLPRRQASDRCRRRSQPETFPNERFLTGVVSNAGLTTVTATAHEHEDGYDQTWTVTAYAVCAPAPAGIERVAASTPVDWRSSRRRITSCPAGKHVLGMGGSINNAQGNVLIDDLKTNTALSKATITGFEDTTGYDSDWNVTAYAICIDR